MGVEPALKYEQLYKEYEALAAERDTFCADCMHIYVLCETLEYWGAMCRNETLTCPAECDPDSLDCPRNKEYEELGTQMETIDNELSMREKEEA